MLVLNFGQVTKLLTEIVKTAYSSREYNTKNLVNSSNFRYEMEKFAEHCETSKKSGVSRQIFDKIGV